MSGLVRLTERVDGGERAQRRARPVLVDPAHVGAVMPRKTYTTIVVQGQWVHVNHPLDEVMRKLGLEEEKWR